jgi:molybdopterin molybdotransferase
MQAGTLISPRLAEESINSRLTCLPIESLPLTQCVGGTLRENIYAERDQPPFDRVAMDGIAIDSAAARQGAQRFRIQAVQAAGAAALKLSGPDHAIEVMTGATLPIGCDCVVPVELIDVLEGFATIKPAASTAPFANVHRRGADSRQGTLLLESGTLLRAPEIAVVASAGMARVRVSSQPAIMVISTGDELVEPGEPIADYHRGRSRARRRGFAAEALEPAFDDSRSTGAEWRRLHGPVRSRAEGAAATRRDRGFSQNRAAAG